MARITKFRSAPAPNITSTSAPSVPGTPTISLDAAGITVLGSFTGSLGGVFGVAGYKLYRQLGGSGSYTYLTTLTGLVFADGTVGLNTAARYKVSAIDSAPTPNESAQSSASNSVTTSATPPTSSSAPSVPFMLPPVAAAGAVTFSSIQSTSHHDGTSAGAGVDSYPYKKDGVFDSNLTAPSSNIKGIPTAYDIGSAGGLSTRLGVNWNLSAGGGSGLDTASDQIRLQGWSYTSIPSVNATISSMSGSDIETLPGSGAGAGVMLRETSSDGSPFIAACLTPAGYVYCLWRGAPNSPPQKAYLFLPIVNGSVAIQAVGDGTYNVYASTGTGNPTLVKHLAATDVVLVSSGIAGVFAYSLTAALFSATFTDISIAPTALISVDVSTDTIVTAAFAGKTGSTTSSYSPEISGTPSEVTGGGSLQKNFGWYFWFAPAGEQIRPDLTTIMDQIKAGLDAIAPYSEVRGFQIGSSWSSMEGDTEGDYIGESWIQELLDYAESKNKKIMWMPVLGHGGYLNVWPAYVTDDSDKGVAQVGGIAEVACVWRPALATSFNNMMVHYGSIFDGHPGLEMVTIGQETSISWEPRTAPSDFNYTDFIGAIGDIAVSVRTSFPTTGVRVEANWGRSDNDFKVLYDKCEAYAIATGGPDVSREELTQANRVYWGLDWPAYESAFPNRITTLAFVAETQQFGLDGAYTLQQIYDAPNGYVPANGEPTSPSMIPRYRVWLWNTYAGSSASQYAAEISFMESHPYSEWPSASAQLPQSYIDYGVAAGGGGGVPGTTDPDIVQASTSEAFVGNSCELFMAGVTPGNSIVVCVAHANGVDYIGYGTSLADDIDGAYNFGIGENHANSASLEWFYLHNVSGGDTTITATALHGGAGGSYGRAKAFECVNLMDAIPDKVAKDTGTTNTPAVPTTGTLSQVKNLAFTAYGDDAIETFNGCTVPPTGWTTETDDDADYPLYIASKITAATTALTTSIGTASGSPHWDGTIIVFKAA